MSVLELVMVTEEGGGSGDNVPKEAVTNAGYRRQPQTRKNYKKEGNRKGKKPENRKLKINFTKERRGRRENKENKEHNLPISHIRHPSSVPIVRSSTKSSYAFPVANRGRSTDKMTIA
jgi:hypothetical protein